VVPPIIHVHDRESALDVLEMIEEKRLAGIDTEFDDDHKLVTWQLSTGENRVLINRDCTKFYKKWLANPKIKKILFAAQADLSSFEEIGIECAGFVGDPWVMDFLVNENRQHHNLKESSYDWLGIPMTSWADTFSYVPEGKKKATLPDIYEIIEKQWKRFLNYATLDPYSTYWLYQHHKTILERLPSTKGKTLWDYYVDHERQFTITLQHVMASGIAVDVNILKEIGKELTKTMARSRHVFVSYAPEISVERTRQGQKYIQVVPPEEIGLRSYQQLSALFFDELGCEGVKDFRNPDKRSTDAENLTKWADEGNILAKYLLEYRQASTMKGTFIGEVNGKGLLSHVQTEMGPWGEYTLLRTILNQIGAITMRLASRDPNLQNIPARKEKDPYRMRRAFVARKGCKLIVGDYAGFELRIMAHSSRDKVMIDAFRNNRDLHSVTTKRIFKLKCPESAVKEKYPDKRAMGKIVNLSLQYGGQAWLLSKRLNISIDEAKAYIADYFDLYKGIANWMEAIVEECRVKGYVQTILGRHRRVIGIDEDPDFDDREAKGRLGHAMRQTMNAPIQGSAADIIKVAMNLIDVDPYLKERECKTLLQVHDELVLECPEIDAKQVQVRVKEIMESVGVMLKLRVPLVVDINIADNWEEGKG